MDALGEQLLSRARLPVDQHRHVVLRRPLGPLHALLELGITPDQIGKVIAFELLFFGCLLRPHLTLQMGQPVAQLRQLSYVIGYLDHGEQLPVGIFDRNGSINGVNIFAAGVDVPLRLIDGGCPGLERTVNRTGLQIHVRKRILKTPADHICRLHLFHPGHNGIVKNGGPLPGHNMNPFIQKA